MSEVIIRVRVETKQAQTESAALETKLKGVEATAKKAGAAVDSVGSASKLTAELMGKLRSVASDLGLAFGAAQLLRGVVWMGQMADASDRTKDALEGLSGSTANADRAIDAMEKVTRGSVSTTNAAALANKILGLEMAKSAAGAAEFAKIGGILGQVFDSSAQAGIENLTSAIANRSIVRLDTLGISSANVARRMEELKRAGHGVDEAFRLATLEEGRRKVEALEAAGVRMGTAADRATAAWENFATALGGTVAPTINATTDGFAAMANAAAQGLNEANSRTENWTMAQNALRQSFAETRVNLEQLVVIQQAYNQALAAGDTQGAAAQRQQLAEAERVLAQAYLQNADAMGMSRGQAAQLFQDLTGLNTAFVLLAGNTIVNRDALNAQTQAAIASSDALIDNKNAALVAREGYADMALASAIARGEAQALTTEAAILEAQLYGVADGANAAGIAIANAFGAGPNLNAMRNKAGSPLFELGDGNGGGIKNVFRNQEAAYQASIATVSRASRAGVSESAKAAREIQQAYEKELSKIRGYAEQALNFSDVVDPLDPLLDEYGLRNEQEASEFARRMRAITNEALSTDGLTTAWKWVEMYKIEGSDLREIAANAEAARRAAISGADLSKLDAGAVARDVEELMANNANRDAFLADVVARVQAKTGAATAKIQEALGQSVGFAVVGAGEAASADLLNSLQSGLAQGIQAEKAAFEGLGADMMRWIVAGATAATTNNGIVGKLKEAIETDILKLLAGEG